MDNFVAARPEMSAPIENDEIEIAAATLRRGGLVAFPTETVYGLGADATNDTAVARIFEAKGRPSFNPLIVHVPSVEIAAHLVDLDEDAMRLTNRFWPGPLTLVLRRRRDCPISLLASAGLDTLAIRVPAHPLAQRLLEVTGRPLAAPSANRSGRLSPTTAAHVRAELGDRIDQVIDGGACAVGVESTILDLTEPRPLLLRPGGLVLESIEAIIGPVVAVTSAEAGVRAPGMLASHYAPGLPVRLNASAARPGEAFVGFGPTPAADAQLSETGDPVEAAANLFTMLRALDRPPFTGIAVTPIPETGLGRAINDRLRRAAAPRDCA